MQHALDQLQLLRLGLFNGQSYFRKNPVVADAGMDPVRDDLIYRIDEERQFRMVRMVC